MSRSLTTKSGNDRIYTPKTLAELCVNLLQPTGSILEPCLGDAAFFDSFPSSEELHWCEIDLGVDFFNFTKKVDWIITNPPFSIFKDFLSHALDLAENVAFLVPINHFTTKARLRLIESKGFGFEVIYLLKETPKEFPQSGFQWGLVHLSKRAKRLEFIL